MIFVDTREPKKLRDIFTDTYPEWSSVTTLRHGEDFVVVEGSNIIGFQRKTITDFLGSLGRGSLDTQLLELQACYLHAILILEGSYTVVDGKIHTPKINTGWGANAFWAKLLSIGQKQGITILPTPSLQATADLLIYLDKRGATKGLSHLLLAESVEEATHVDTDESPTVPC